MYEMMDDADRERVWYYRRAPGMYDVAQGRREAVDGGGSGIRDGGLAGVRWIRGRRR